MSRKGILSIVSGFSGAGKGTVMKALLSKYDNYALSISATSRAPRVGEQEGREYFYKTVEQFEEMIKNNELIEYAQYVGNYYGTPKAYVEQMLNEGKDVILEIEIQGALKVKELVPDAIFIFILPPSMKELKRRLITRGTDSMEKILSRFKTAYKEINEVTKYNYVVISDEVENAVLKVKSILYAERCRVDRIEEVFLNNMEEEVHELLVEKELNNDVKEI